MYIRLFILFFITHLLQSQDFISANGRDLQLNGSKIMLKGMCIGNRVWENIALPTDHITEEDYKIIAATGSNVARFYFNYLTLEDDNNPFVYKQAGWSWFDQNIQWAKKHGIYLILNCHVPPGGFQSQCKGAAFWTNTFNQKRTAALWLNIAEKYKNETQIAGYDIINEPTPLDSIAQWQKMAQRLIDTIRTVDMNHLVIVERVNAVNCNWSNNANMNYVKVNDKGNNIMYTFHFYTPYEYTHQLQSWAGTGEGGPYPDENKIIMPNDLKWITGIFNNPRPIVGNTTWTYYDGELYKVTDSSLIAGHAALVTSKIGAGSIWFDDFVVKEYDEKGVFVRDILSTNIEDLDSWDAWTSNNTGEATLDFGGHAGLYCIKYSGSTGDASINNWDNKFSVKYNYSYKISGFIKTKDLPNSSFSMFSISFYNSPSGKKPTKRNKAFLYDQVSEYVQFGINNNVPLYVGEFGLVRDCFDNNRGGATFVKDLLNVFDDFNLHYTMHVYRENSFGLFTGVSGPVDTITATAALQVLQANLKKNVNNLESQAISKDLNTLIIYPNPAQSVLQIQCSKSVQVQIIDILGNLRLKSDNKIIDVETLPIGLYTIIATVDNRQNYLKFVKE